MFHDRLNLPEPYSPHQGNLTSAANHLYIPAKQPPLHFPNTTEVPLTVIVPSKLMPQIPVPSPANPQQLHQLIFFITAYKLHQDSHRSHLLSIKLKDTYSTV